MKRVLLLPLLVAILIVCARPLAAAATENVPPAKPATPGVEMAEAISTITGVAISPLLGVSAVGAWKYYSANTPVARANLPWFAQPWFWLPGFLVVGICALKDVFGISVPAALKKPFDVIETVAHKVSGLVAAGAFVPLIASVFKSAGMAAPPLLNAGAAHGFLAVIHSSWLYNSLAVVTLLLMFFIVFLASNAINILILLSPFPIVDAALKLFRLAVLSTVVFTAFANPWLGAVWSLVIFIVAYFIAGWSFRLSHFGTLFIWDFSTRRYARFLPNASVNWMFLSRTINQVPIRTYGKFSRNASGDFVFNYRPWLVLSPRSLTLPPGIYAVGKGLFYSEIVRMAGQQSRPVLLLPPRYRSHEAELAAIYGLTGVREAGLRAAFVWLKEWVGFRPRQKLIAL